MNYLIDTDWIIDHLNQVESVTARLHELAPEGLALSVVSLGELYEGVYYSRDPEASERSLQRFLNRELTILGIDEETCKRFGRERGRLRMIGQRIGDMDLMIAATALQYDCTLLTNNRRHFERVEGLRIQSV
jgi:predicted nucleic acid-binding protein